MPWDPNKPAGTDAANTIDNSIIDNNNALDTIFNALTDGIAQGAAAVFKAYRAANVVIAKFRAAAGDTQDRFRYDLNGLIEWGSGSATPDTSLSRTAVSELSLGADDLLRNSGVNRLRHLNSIVQTGRGTSQSIPNNAITTVIWNAESFDTDTMHDDATNNTRLTAKVAGKYLILFQGSFEPNSSGRRVCRIVHNGTTVLARGEFAATSGGDTTMFVHAVRNMALNDYAEGDVFQNSGAALNLRGNDSTEGTSTFSIFYLGE